MPNILRVGQIWHGQLINSPNPVHLRLSDKVRSCTRRIQISILSTSLRILSKIRFIFFIQLPEINIHKLKLSFFVIISLGTYHNKDIFNLANKSVKPPLMHPLIWLTQILYLPIWILRANLALDSLVTRPDQSVPTLPSAHPAHRPSYPARKDQEIQEAGSQDYAISHMWLKCCVLTPELGTDQPRQGAPHPSWPIIAQRQEDLDDLLGFSEVIFHLWVRVTSGGLKGWGCLIYLTDHIGI